MARATRERNSLLSRRVQLRWLLAAVGGLIVVIAIVMTTLLLVGRSRDQARRAAAEAAARVPEVNSPYDLTELPAETSLKMLEQTAFVSILIQNQDGTFTSYGISSDRPATRALIDAVKHAEPDGNLKALIKETIVGS